jgi:hypothetical protein
LRYQDRVVALALIAFGFVFVPLDGAIESPTAHRVLEDPAFAGEVAHGLTVHPSMEWHNTVA